MTSVPIRWRDFDPIGHVNSAVYMTLLETGRDAWLEATMGASFADSYVLARIEIDFRREIRLGTACVETEHRVSKVGTSSITLCEKLVDAAGDAFALARVVIVAWDNAAQRSRTITDAERDALYAATAAL